MLRLRDPAAAEAGLRTARPVRPGSPPPRPAPGAAVALPYRVAAVIERGQLPACETAAP
ncbi:hypothetical protein [Streptomyces xanthophaeus]|uniref:hypothetical protein n=1 Tax=Streptomyces xanthophaeus TaxID=67385 RepID=UPI00364AD394